MLLRCSRATVVRDGESLLRDVSFELDAGQTLAVLGLNGAGKSTLINALASEIALSRGEVLIDGDSITQLDAPALAERRALNAVEPPLAFSLTVFDYVALGRPFDVANETELASALRTCHAEQWAARDAASLSSGELLRVQLARSLYQLGRRERCVWLLDEPMAHLDLAQRAFVLSLLRGVASERKWAVVFSTHEPSDARAIADRCLLLRRGEMYATGAAHEALTTETIVGCYGIACVEDASPR